MNLAAGSWLPALPDGRRAMLLMAVFAVAWVLLEAVVGARVQQHYNLMQVVWWRYAAHLATLLLLFGWRRPERLWRTARPRYQLARSLLMLVMPLSFALALGTGMSGDTIWAVFWIAPLLTIVCAHALLGERVAWPVWIAALLGTFAAAAMLAPVPPASPWQLLLPIVMAVSFSVYVVMTRSLRSEPVLANLFYTAFGVFLALTPLMPAVWITPSAHDAVVLTAIGVVGLVALLALDRSAAFAPVAGVAPILYLHVVCLAGVDLLRGELPSQPALAGAAVIIAIAAFLWSREDRRDRIRQHLPTAPSEDSVQ